MSYEIYSSPNKIGQQILQMQSLLLQKWKLKTLLNQHENMRRQHSIPIPLNIADNFYMQTKIC